MPLELKPHWRREVITQTPDRYQQQVWNTGGLREPPGVLGELTSKPPACMSACLTACLFVKVVFFVPSNSTVAAPPPGPRWDAAAVPQSAANNKSEANFCLPLMEQTLCWLPLRRGPCDAAPSPRRLLTNQTPCELQPDRQLLRLAVRTALFPSM